jgi:hypothetical protein
LNPGPREQKAGVLSSVNVIQNVSLFLSTAFTQSVAPVFRQTSLSKRKKDTAFAPQPWRCFTPVFWASFLDAFPQQSVVPRASIYHNVFSTCSPLISRCFPAPYCCDQGNTLSGNLSSLTCSIWPLALTCSIWPLALTCSIWPLQCFALYKIHLPYLNK